MNITQLKDLWKSEETRSFEGWDFSYITNRTEEEQLPWDYEAIVRANLLHDHRLLDMGTGGGEFLLSLNHPYEYTSATEYYPPNYELCQRTLVPLGITVKQVKDDDQLPFEENSFDLVINRHESFDMKEVRRVLKPQGLFITQQVGGLNNKELSQFLIPQFKEIISSEFNLQSNVKLVKQQGFKVLQEEEYYPYLRFYDVGALVYLAKIIEWEFPDFSVDQCFEQLCKLQEIVEQNGFIESQEHRFLIIAQNDK